jgi:serine/threonine protein kinase
MAPELYLEEVTQSLAKSDVFALGVILINFLTGKYPFRSVYDEVDGERQKSKEYETFMRNPKDILQEFDDSLIELVTGML